MDVLYLIVAIIILLLVILYDRNNKKEIKELKEIIQSQAALIEALGEKVKEYEEDETITEDEKQFVQSLAEGKNEIIKH